MAGVLYNYLNEHKSGLRNLFDKSFSDDEYIISYNPNKNILEQITESVKTYFGDQFKNFMFKCDDSIEKLESRVKLLEDSAKELKAKDVSYLESAKKTRKIFVVLILNILKFFNYKSKEQKELENQWRSLSYDSYVATYNSPDCVYILMDRIQGGRNPTLHDLVKNPFTSKICILINDDEGKEVYRSYFDVLQYLKNNNSSSVDQIQKQADDYSNRIKEVKSKLKQPLFSLV